MLPDRVSNPGPLTYESGALPTALHGPAKTKTNTFISVTALEVYPHAFRHDNKPQCGLPACSGCFLFIEVLSTISVCCLQRKSVIASHVNRGIFKGYYSVKWKHFTPFSYEAYLK